MQISLPEWRNVTEWSHNIPMENWNGRIVTIHLNPTIIYKSDYNLLACKKNKRVVAFGGKSF